MEYDAWFAQHEPAYRSELAAVRAALRSGSPSLEIGAGTGRFAGPLGITFGVEPAWAMAALARARGLKVILARGEALPFAAAVFDLVLLVTVLCFVREPLQVLQEAYRVLKPRGQLVVALLDPHSPLGRRYEAYKDKSKFYRQAQFRPVPQVWEWLRGLGLGKFQIYQTIFQDPAELTTQEPVRRGYGEGLFVVLAAAKP